MIGATIFQAVGLLEKFSTVVITIFSSIIFSWLLTKVTSKQEWEEQEQKLALRSYRHIDYIESASKTAKQIINQYIVGESAPKITDEQKLILSDAMDYIGYIQGGIRTCKMDWYDLMSEEEKAHCSQRGVANQTIDMNQEDV